MRRLQVVFNWVRHLVFSRRVEREMQAEMRAHIEQQAALNRARGMSAEDALADARREFGNVSYMQEEARDARGTRYVQETLQDVRYGLRALRRTPGFTVVALLSLTLGIGVNTAMFTFMRFIFAPPSISDPATFVSIPWFVTYPTWKILAAEPGLFSRTAAVSSVSVALPRSDRSALEAQVQLVSDGFFALYEGRPLLGRLLVAGEERDAGGVPAAVLSHSFWQREYGSDSAVIGRVLPLSNGSSFTIVGVASPDFSGTHFRIPDVWIPLAARELLPGSASGVSVDWLNDPDRQWLTISGRLAPGVSFENARLHVKSIVAHAGNADTALADYISERFERGDDTGLNSKNAAGAAFMFSATLMVLLIGCANVANLVLARGANRRREIAVRLSLGAGRMRLLRQLTTESLILACVGGVCALTLSAIGLRLFAHSSLAQSVVASAGDSMAARLSPTPGIVLFTFVAALVSAALCGLLPALRTTRMDLSSATRDDGRAIGGRLARSKLRAALVVGQVAMSLVLLTTASVLLRSSTNATVMDLGFDRGHLVLAQVGATETGYSAAQLHQFANGYAARLAVLVGDSNVARGSIPFTPLTWLRLNPELAQRRTAARILASGSYFSVMGIPMTSGRTFTDLEVRNGSPVVVVGASLAKRLWPDARAVGQRLTVAEEGAGHGADSLKNLREVTVIGVARDAQFASIGSSATSLLYVPADSGQFVVRTPDPERLAGAVRDAGRIEDHRVLLTVRSMAEFISQNAKVQSAGATAMYAGALGALALTLSLIGIFGVVAYTVSQRTREIGVRLAIGAQRVEVLLMVIRQGVRPVVYGTLIGLVLSAGATRALRVMLFGVSSLDPAAFAAATLGVTLAAMLACYFPARRATRVDPVIALRAD